MHLKKLILLCVTITFIILGYGVAIPLGEYIRETKGASIIYISLLFSLYSLGQLIAAPILGRLGDIFGAKKIMILSIIIYLFAFLASINIMNKVLVLIFRFITGMFAGSTVLTIESYIGEHSPEDKRIRYYTFTSLSIALGMIIGPIIGVIIIRNNLLITAIWIVIAFVLILCLNKELYHFEIKRHSNNFIADFIEKFSKAIHDKQNIYLFSGFFMLGLISSSIESTGLAFVIDNYKIKEINILFVLILIVLVMLYVLFINTTLTNKVDKYKYSMVMILLTGVGLLVMSFSRNINILILGFMIVILGLSSMVSTMSTLITLGKEKNGMLLGIRNTVMGIGAITGPLVAASIYEINSYLFLMISSILCLLIVIYGYFKKVYE